MREGQEGESTRSGAIVSDNSKAMEWQASKNMTSLVRESLHAHELTCIETSHSNRLLLQ